MTVPPPAHAGHWIVQIAYLGPLVVLVAMLLLGKLRERRERRLHRDDDGVTDA
jgi:hypothetical protein